MITQVDGRWTRAESISNLMRYMEAKREQAMAAEQQQRGYREIDYSKGF